jgi:hypothetical protein
MTDTRRDPDGRVTFIGYRVWYEVEFRYLDVVALLPPGDPVPVTNAPFFYLDRVSRQ